MNGLEVFPDLYRIFLSITINGFNLKGFFWFLIPAGHVALLGLLWRTSLLISFPWFSFMLFQDLLQIPTLAFVYDPHGSVAYTVVYGVCEVVDLCTQLLAFHEFSVAKNKRLRIIAGSLALYIVVELGKHGYVWYQQSHHKLYCWPFAVMAIQPLYLTCEVIWFVMIYRAYHRAKYITERRKQSWVQPTNKYLAIPALQGLLHRLIQR